MDSNEARGGKGGPRTALLNLFSFFNFLKKSKYVTLQTSLKFSQKRVNGLAVGCVWDLYWVVGTNRLSSLFYFFLCCYCCCFIKGQCYLQRSFAQNTVTCLCDSSFICRKRLSFAGVGRPCQCHISMCLHVIVLLSAKCNLFSCHISKTICCQRKVICWRKRLSFCCQQRKCMGPSL